MTSRSESKNSVAENRAEDINRDDFQHIKNQAVAQLATVKSSEIANEERAKLEESSPGVLKTALNALFGQDDGELSKSFTGAADQGEHPREENYDTRIVSAAKTKSSVSTEIAMLQPGEVTSSELGVVVEPEKIPNPLDGESFFTQAIAGSAVTQFSVARLGLMHYNEAEESEGRKMVAFEHTSETESGVPAPIVSDSDLKEIQDIRRTIMFDTTASYAGFVSQATAAIERIPVNLYREDPILASMYAPEGGPSSSPEMMLRTSQSVAAFIAPALIAAGFIDSPTLNRAENREIKETVALDFIGKLAFGRQQQLVQGTAMPLAQLSTAEYAATELPLSLAA